MTTDTPIFADACTACGCSTTYEATGTVAEADDTVELTLPANVSSLALQIDGSWTGTLKVEGTIDGANYVDLDLFTLPGSSPQTDIIANGAYLAIVPGFEKVRVRGHSDFSGEADVTMRATSGSGMLGELLQAVAVPASAQVVWTKTAVALAGNVSQQLLAASSTRKSWFVFNPTGNDNIYVDVSGGDAAVGGRTVYPDGDFNFQGEYSPTNTVTVKGTNGQTIYVYTAA